MTGVFRTELIKQLRRPRTFVALGIAVLIPTVATIALKANPPTPQGGDQGLFSLAPDSGLLVAVALLRFMSRFLLVRPIRRPRLLGAKLSVSALLTVTATVLIALTGLVAGGIAFGWSGVSVPFSGLSQSAGQLFGNVVLATLYVTWSLGAVLAFAFFVSTLTDVPSGGVGAGIGLYIVSQILDNISSLGSIRYGMPTHYLDAWNDLFFRHGPSAEMLRGTIVQLGYIVFFCALAFWRFQRKDILS